MTVRSLCLMLMLAFCAGPWPRTAQAQVHRCTMPDGRPLFTDQKCEALGATDTVVKPATPEANRAGLDRTGLDRTGLYRAACSRTLRDLAFELTSAIEAGDANRLSSLYLWGGMGDAAAIHVMDRLELIAHRPLLDIQPVSGQPEADAAITGETDVPRTTVRQPPVGLRLEQTLPNGITRAPTVLGLHRHYGCWWVTL
jgi:hypothetical protein